MTIERQWLEVMKSEVPEAFTSEIPLAPRAGFIDAQIKLMAMPHECMWDVYLRKQFLSPVLQLLGAGALTVVLAFDDYANVPRAKAITQAKRRARIVPIEFTGEQELPESPPMPWDAAMANREFKAKVVAWVTQELPPLVPLHQWPGSALVVDWRGESVDYWTAESDGVVKEERPRCQVGSECPPPRAS